MEAHFKENISNFYYYYLYNNNFIVTTVSIKNTQLNLLQELQQCKPFYIYTEIEKNNKKQIEIITIEPLTKTDASKIKYKKLTDINLTKTRIIHSITAPSNTNKFSIKQSELNEINRFMKIKSNNSIFDEYKKNIEIY